DDGGGLEEHGDEIRARQHENRVAADRVAARARQAGLQVDDDEAAAELADAATANAVAQDQIGGAEEWKDDGFRTAIEHDHARHHDGVDRRRDEALAEIGFRIMRRQREGELVENRIVGDRKRDRGQQNESNEEPGIHANASTYCRTVGYLMPS